jgi:Ni2+-binding GTPase involved in maturation of urease and hydrogenase
MIELLAGDGYKSGVVKFDCSVTYDNRTFERAGIPVKVGLSGNLCPDHFYVTNIENCYQWGQEQDFDFLITESAGLCNRCSPHIKEVAAVCVIDNLSGINTPKKVGPMLKLADIAVITKGDIVSQAEREVFAFKVKQSNPKAAIMFVNGITGQGAFDLCARIKNTGKIDTLTDRKLRFSMPAALCSYCIGETRIGAEYQVGNTKKMTFK